MEITTAELKELIDKKEKYVLIDVREKDELEYGMIPTAKHIPLREIQWALETSPEAFQRKFQFPQPQKSELLIFHCRTGGRSEQATRIAKDLGFTQAKNYAGSIWEWSKIDPQVQRY